MLFGHLRPSIRCCSGQNCSYLPLSRPSQTGLSHKQPACTPSLPDDSQQRSPTSCFLTPSGCACGLQTSLPDEADNLISWDEPQTYNGEAVKGQVFGRPHASLADSTWARSMLGPTQVTEQQDVVEAEAGALLCTAALPAPLFWYELSERDICLDRRREVCRGMIRLLRLNHFPTGSFLATIWMSINTVVHTCSVLTHLHLQYAL